MKKTKIALAVMIFGAAAAQADYQFEVSAALSGANFETEVEDYYDGDYDYDAEVEGFGLDATVYLQAVSTATGPLAEAAFLSKASEIGVGIVRQEVTLERDFYGDYDYDVDMNAVVGQFVVPGPNLIIRGVIGRGEDNDLDTDLLMVGFGGYITDRISLILDYSELEYDTDYSDDTIETWKITYKQLIDLDGTQALTIEPYLSSEDYHGDDAAAIGVDVTWYVMRSLGIRAGVEGYAREEDFGDYSSGTSHIGVDYFISENFRIGGELFSLSSEFDGDGGYDEETEGGGIEFNAAVRF